MFCMLGVDVLGQPCTAECCQAFLWKPPKVCPRHLVAQWGEVSEIEPR
jgi:hypothetical protein